MDFNEFMAQQIKAQQAGDTALRQAINLRTPERLAPVNNPLAAALPVQESRRYSVEGLIAGTPADLMAVPVAVDGENPVMSGSVSEGSWKGETDKFGLKLRIDERDLRVMREEIALSGGQASEDLARAFFQRQFVVRARRAMENAELKAAMGILTAGKYTLTTGVGVTVDMQLPASQIRSRTGAESYVAKPSNLIKDDYANTRKLGFVARRIMSLETYEAITATPSGTSGIIVEDESATDEFGNFTVTLSALAEVNATGAFSMAGIRDPKFRNRQFLIIGQRHVEHTATGVVETPIMASGVVVWHGAGVMGYHHVGPTEQGAGQTGRYAELSNPRAAQYEMDMWENHVPVVTERSKLLITKTDLS